MTADKKDSIQENDDRRRQWPRAILHLDMDAFFVNVHRLEHPEDNGIPLAVGGRPYSRSALAGLLWGDAPEKARTSNDR